MAKWLTTSLTSECLESNPDFPSFSALQTVCQRFNKLLRANQDVCYSCHWLALKGGGILLRHIVCVNP